MSGWNPPPAPGGPPGPGPYGYGPPRPMPYPSPPRRSSNAGLIIGLILGIGVVFVLVVVVVVVVVAASGSHTIGTPPSTAGGYARDYAAESRYSSQLNSQRSILRRSTNYAVTDTYSAVYGTGSEKYLFVGGNGNFDPDDLYSQFRSGMNSEITNNVSVLVIPLADAGGDGEAVCATVMNRQSTSTYSTAICAWSTNDTFGMIMPIPDSDSLTTSRNYSYSTVASTMRLMRDDLED